MGQKGDLPGPFIDPAKGFHYSRLKFDLESEKQRTNHRGDEDTWRSWTSTNW